MIRSIDGGNNPNKFKELIRLMKEQLPDQIQFYVLSAKLHRAKYLALIEEGFTAAEALELSKTL